MKYCLIANPAAKKGDAQSLIPQATRRLRELGVEFDLALTEKPWHAAELALRASADGYEGVAAAGGDGTINEVINGLMQARKQGYSRPYLGVLCIGRGNDFAYGAGLPTRWEAGCQALASGQRKSIDLGRVEGECLAERQNGNGALTGERYFGNGIGIGFDAVVNVQATKTRLSGFAGYTVAVLRTILLHFKSPLVQIDCDHTTLTQPSLMISIMNGRRMGGGFLMAPHGASNDGQLDLCIARQVSRATILAMIPRFMRGTQAGHPAIRFMRSQQVKVTALNGDRLPMHIDGETVCLEAKEVKVEVLPRALEVICPPTV